VKGANVAKKSKAEEKPRGVFERPKGSGVWWIHWYDHNSQRRRQKIGTFAAAKRARGEVKALVHKINKGALPPEALVEAKYLSPSDIGLNTDLTLKEFVTACIPELKQKKSWKDLKRFSESWVKLIGHFNLSDIEAKHAVKRRTARLDKGASPSTCNRETEFLRAILNRAVREGHLLVNPLTKLSDLPEDNIRVRSLTDNEEQRLEAEMTAEKFDLVAVAMDTGLRRAKVFGLPWVDVDLERGWITVKGAKAGSSRQVPMTQRVLAILERRRQSQKGAWVFPNRTGARPMAADNFCKRQFRPALERAGIHDFKFHDLRHTFASRLAMAGKGGRVLTGLLGHKSTKTTDRYAHLEPEAFRAAVDVLNKDKGDSKGGLWAVK
jgi:integrase